jgi:acetyl esterase/lipase
VPLALQLLIEPMIDDRTVTTAEPLPHIGQYVWTAADNHFGWSCYLGQGPGGDGVSAYAAPARAEQLDGLPATFIAVGALDLFLEEDLAYARRLLRAGVPTELHVYPGTIHGLTLLVEAQVTRTYTQAVVEALRRAFSMRSSLS